MASPKHDYILVAAIDFGTTYSGYAFSFQTNPQSIGMNKTWKSSMSPDSNKCPTSVLTKPDGGFKSFGYEAEEEYNQLDSDTGCQLYRNFKMVLFEEDFTSTSSVHAVSGHQEKAITIFSMALKYLKDHLIESIKTAGSELDWNDIHWVLTVPAIWSIEAKHFMRQSAFEAGLISEVNSTTLTLVLEPEAASFYVRLNEDTFAEVRSKTAETKFRTGEKVLIIDAGGGTVDITAHEIQIDGQVKEIVKPSGGPWGGTQVEAKFMKLLKQTLGPDFINYLKSKNPQQWLYFISHFERAKKAFKDDGTYTMKLLVPFTFDKLCQEMNGKGIESLLREVRDVKLTFLNGFFVIRHDIAMELYQESCTNIVNHVGELLKTPELSGLHYIVLVGGYSESLVLQNALKRSFGDSFKIIVPLYPQLAIVKGAVLFGHQPLQILSRVSTATYGCQADLLFDEKIHDPKRRYASRRDGQMRCRGTFKEFVKVGDNIRNPEVKTHTFHPLSRNETQVTIPFLMSHKSNVIYCNERGVHRIGKIKLKSPEGPLGEDIEVRVTFGHTEILLEARDTTRGEGFLVKTTLDFSVNQ